MIPEHETLAARFGTGDAGAPVRYSIMINAVRKGGGASQRTSSWPRRCGLFGPATQFAFRLWYSAASLLLANDAATQEFCRNRATQGT